MAASSVERVERGRVRRGRGTLSQAERCEELALELQLADADPEHDADHADDDRQQRDAKRKLPIAGQHEEHRGDRERDLHRVDDRVVLVFEAEPVVVGDGSRAAIGQLYGRLRRRRLERADDHVDDERQQEGEPGMAGEQCGVTSGEWRMAVPLGWVVPSFAVSRACVGQIRRSLCWSVRIWQGTVAGRPTAE